jgi:hypothetical protein
MKRSTYYLHPTCLEEQEGTRSHFCVVMGLLLDDKFLKEPGVLHVVQKEHQSVPEDVQYYDHQVDVHEHI